MQAVQSISYFLSCFCTSEKVDGGEIDLYSVLLEVREEGLITTDELHNIEKMIEIKKSDGETLINAEKKVEQERSHCLKR